MPPINFFNPENRDELIEYLSKQKILESKTENKAHLPKLSLEQIKNYCSELENKTLEELKSLYKETEIKLNEELRKKLEKEEQERFYNQPWANANLNRWSKMPYWTLNEAVTLSFGKDPDHVNWKKIEPLLPYNFFAIRYRQLYDLVARAKNWEDLYDPIIPGFYIAWVKRNNIDFPAQLERMVVEHGGKIADWKTKFDDLKAKYESKVELDEQKINDQERIIKNLTNEKENLLTQINNLQTIPHNKLPKISLSTKERNTLLTLLVGMAKAYYQYDKSAKRSDVCRTIIEDLNLSGLHVDIGTLRKWLKIANEIDSLIS